MLILRRLLILSEEAPMFELRIEGVSLPPIALGGEYSLREDLAKSGYSIARIENGVEPEVARRDDAYLWAIFPNTHHRLGLAKEALVEGGFEFGPVMLGRSVPFLCMGEGQTAGQTAVTATVTHRHPTDGAETIDTSTGHRLQYGYGSGGDGFCYTHQSFDCIESLTDDERVAIKNARESQ